MRSTGVFVESVAAMAVAGCEIAVDRTGYADAWSCERLTPCYENTLPSDPRIGLHAVQELVGEDVLGRDGSIVRHVDCVRPDIETFFAAPVASPNARLKFSRPASRETCPRTDVSTLVERIGHSGPTCLVFTDISREGYSFR